MDAPREVFILENVTGQIFVHSTKGPMVFVELEHAQAIIDGHPESTLEDPRGTPAQRKAEILGKKWAVTRIPMNKELGSQPFRYYDEKKCDTQQLPEHAIYLADLRDKVAMAASNPDVVVSIMPGLPTDTEYLELRAKLKELGVNVRAVRKLPKLRAMLAEAEAVTV